MSIAFATPSASFQHVRMTAGSVDPNSSTSTPAKKAFPAPTPLPARVEMRPEVVGGLPLWLTLGFARQVRRMTNTLSKVPFQVQREKSIARVEEKIAKFDQQEHANTQDLPVGRALHKVADIVEEEVGWLRLTLQTVQGDLARSIKEADKLRKQLERMVASKKEEELSGGQEKTLRQMATQLRKLHTKEQIRASAAEKRLRQLSARCEMLEKEKSQLQADLVKLSALYCGLAVVTIASLMHVPGMTDFARAVLENVP